MNDDLERRLRASLGERSADPLRGEAHLPEPTRRRARVRRAGNAVSALLAVAIVIGGTTTLVNSRFEPAVPPASLPDGSPTRVPEPTPAGTPSRASVPQTTPPKEARDRVAVIDDAGSKLVAHGRVWIAATTRLLAYTPAGKLAARLVITEVLGDDVVLERRILAADDSGIWVAGAGADDIERTRGNDDCAVIDPLGGDRDGESFVVRIDATSLCPSVFIKLGHVPAAEPSPGILPSSSTPAPARSRFVRWHGLAHAAGALWIGADGGMVRVDLADGSRRELGLDAYSVGAGFGSVWAAVAQKRGTPEEDDFIARIDPETGEVIATIDVPPADPETTTDFAEVHVGPDAVWAEGWGIAAQIDPATNDIVARYPIGGEHIRGDMTSGGGRFYLADNGLNADGVWVVDAGRRTRLAKITLGAAASGIVLVDGHLWFNAGDVVSRIRIA